MEWTPRDLLVMIPSLPIAIVYLIGLVISATKLGQHRKAAGLAVAGFATLLLGQLGRIASSTVMLSPRSGMSTRDLGIRLMAINLTSTMMILGGTVLLLLAIFAGRGPERR